MITESSNLENLLGGYFHQDWATYASTPAGVLEQYLKDGWSVEEIMKTLQELQALLQEDDTKLQAAVTEMGCDYYPLGHGITTYRDWLSQVAQRLSEYLAGDK